MLSRNSRLVSRFPLMTEALLLGTLVAAASACSSPDGGGGACQETLPTREATAGLSTTDLGKVFGPAVVGDDDRIMIPMNGDAANSYGGRIWSGTAWKTVNPTLNAPGSSASIGVPLFTQHDGKFLGFETTATGSAWTAQIFSELDNGAWDNGQQVYSTITPITAYGYSLALGKEIAAGTTGFTAPYSLSVAERSGAGALTPSTSYLGTTYLAPVGTGYFTDGTPWVVMANGQQIVLKRRVGSAWTDVATLRTVTAPTQIFFANVISAAEGSANPTAMVTWTEFSNSGSNPVDTVYAVPVNTKTITVGAVATLLPATKVAVTNSFIPSGAFNADGTKMLYVIQDQIQFRVWLGSYDGTNFTAAELYKPSLAFNRSPTVYFTAACGTPMIVHNGKDPTDASAGYPWYVDSLRPQDFDGVAGN